MTSTGSSRPYFALSTNQGTPALSARCRALVKAAPVNSSAAGPASGALDLEQPTSRRSALPVGDGRGGGGGVGRIRVGASGRSTISGRYRRYSPWRIRTSSGVRFANTLFEFFALAVAA